MDRLVLNPTEFVWSLKHLVVALAFLFILGGVYWLGFSPAQAWNVVTSGGVALLGAVIAGTVITPLLLPWIPGQAFSLKGYQIGFVWALAFIAYRWDFFGAGASPSITSIAAALLFLPATSAYFALNFTGASTYTSLSGVRKEMGLALPAIIGSVMIGAVIFIIGLIA